MCICACHFHGSTLGKFLFVLYFVKRACCYLNVYLRNSQVVVQFNDSTLDKVFCLEINGVVSLMVNLFP